MIYFNEIRPSDHYLEHHAEDVPWPEVVRLVLETKSPRKKGNAFVIERDSYYVMFKIKEGVLWVLNAKRT